jgi:hypothetical protein
MCGGGGWSFGRAGSASAAAVTLRGSIVVIRPARSSDPATRALVSEVIEALAPAAQVVLDLTASAHLAERIDDWLDQLERWDA